MSDYANPQVLVDTDWVTQHLDDKNVRIVESDEDVLLYEVGHIPGAVFFDIDAIADRTTGLPHMLPTPGEFSKAVGALGIGDGETVVAYDGAGSPKLRIWLTMSAGWKKNIRSGNSRASRRTA